MLIGKNNEGLKWLFTEENFGDKPRTDNLIEAINQLVPMEPKTLSKQTNGNNQPAAKPLTATPSQQPASSSQPNTGVVAEKAPEQVA